MVSLDRCNKATETLATFGRFFVGELRDCAMRVKKKGQYVVFIPLNYRNNLSFSMNCLLTERRITPTAIVHLAVLV